MPWPWPSKDRGAPPVCRLARFERDTRPTQFASHGDVLPIMRAFVQDSGLRAADAVNIDRMLREFVWKRLFDVEERSIDSRFRIAQPIENRIDNTPDR